MTITIGKKQVFIAVVSLLTLGIISSSIYFFVQYRKSQALLKNPIEAAKTENKTLAQTIADIVDVPEGEEPTVANVSDTTQLANQPFFSKAVNGDKVIFYPTSQRAILYRPSTGKIIEMSAVTTAGDVAGTTDTQPAPEKTGFPVSTTATPIPTPRPFNLAILNGTQTPKMASSFEKLVGEKLKNVTVVVKDNAVKQDYTKSIVIDVKGTFSSESKAVAGLVGADIEKLPEGQTAPEDADILVILGANYLPE